MNQVDILARLLCAKGLSYSTKPLKYGRQYNFNGATLSLFHTGKLLWQGSSLNATERENIERLVSKSGKIAQRIAYKRKESIFNL